MYYSVKLSFKIIYPYISLKPFIHIIIFVKPIFGFKYHILIFMINQTKVPISQHPDLASQMKSFRNNQLYTLDVLPSAVLNLQFSLTQYCIIYLNIKLYNWNCSFVQSLTWHSNCRINKEGRKEYLRVYIYIFFYGYIAPGILWLRTNHII